MAAMSSGHIAAQPKRRLAGAAPLTVLLALLLLCCQLNVARSQATTTSGQPSADKAARGYTELKARAHLPLDAWRLPRWFCPPPGRYELPGRISPARAAWERQRLKIMLQPTTQLQ